MSPGHKRSKLFTVEYGTMIALGLFNCLFGQSSLAALPVLMNSRGVSESAAGVLNMLFPLACICFRRYAVKIGSRVSSSRSICFCFVLLAGSNLCLDVLPGVGWVIPIRIAQGLAICYIAGVIASLVAETVPADRFEEGMGYFSIAIPVMSFFGPALCRVLIERVGYSQTLRGLSAVMIVPIILSLAVRLPQLRPVERAPGGEREPFLERKSVPPSLLLMGSAMAATCTVSFLPLYAQKYDLNHTLFFYLAAGVGVLGIRVATTVFHKTIPEKLSIPVASGVLALVLLVLPRNGQPALAVVMGVAYGISVGLVQPYFIAMALRAAEPGHKSVATVTYYIFNDIGTSAGGMLWGYIAQYVGYYAVFVTAAAINLAAFGGWLGFMRGTGVVKERSAAE